MNNKDTCTICGKEFGLHETSYFGHLLNGEYAYTCIDCSKQLIDTDIYSNYKNNRSLPAPNAKLWRYMDLAKFLYLLENNSLYFTRLDHFKDKFEGALGMQHNEKNWEKMEVERRKRLILMNNKSISEDNLNKTACDMLNEVRTRMQEFRKSNYVNCWHQSDCESEAMWQLYTTDNKQGIAIQTTFERLYNSLPDYPNPEFGLVNYIDFNDYNNGVSKNFFSPHNSIWYKRKSFAHEKEFRVVIKDIRRPAFRDWNKDILVNLNQLIENIYISPEADSWFLELVRDIVGNRYNLNLNVKQSELNVLPFY